MTCASWRAIIGDMEVPGLTVAAVARRLGVAPSTLRAWERRYGVGPSAHVAGARRRYSPDDLSRLEYIRRLTLDGVALADAARAVLGGVTAAAPRPLSLPAADGRLALLDEPVGRPGGPGGRVIAVPEGTPRARGLARAAQALDAAAVREVLAAAVAEHGVLTTWELLLCPVLRAVGDRWVATGEGVEVEHLLVECAGGVLRAVADRAPLSRNGRPVLLACADGEAHCLPVHALAAALAERDVSSRVLGAAMPVAALFAAVRRTGPAALFVFAQVPADASAFDDLPVTRPPTAVLAGGAGWDPARLPARVTYAHDLGDAVHLIQVACGVG